MNDKTTMSTLTSLAILKVNVDLGGDYLNYLSPFVLQVLADRRPGPITEESVRAAIAEAFGLDIPERTIQIVLKRLARKYPLSRKHGEFRVVGELPDPNLTAKTSEAERQMSAVIRGLQDFSSDTNRPILTPEDAVASLCAFLSEFSVTCLRAYLHGTAIPRLEETRHSDLVLISEYVQKLQASDPERFRSFLILVQGHMLANALLCPDLRSAPATYRRVTFYLDTPLLVHALNLEGDAKKNAICELVQLLKNLGGTIAVFSHSQDELRRVLQGAAARLDEFGSHSPIVIEARKRGTTKSDLLLLAESTEEKLDRLGIEVHATPPYSDRFQIDEVIFRDVLTDEVTYFNPRAEADDINSVRSVYTLRGDSRVATLEAARAVLVTSNTAFARAAWDYGQEYESSQEVSSVISDFSLANLAWLKAPVGSPAIPTTQVLAFAYAALEPSAEMLSKYMREIDRLEEHGTITPRDLQLLRSSTLAYDSVMHLTLGEVDSLSEGTVLETLERITEEIRKEEADKLAAEKVSHGATLEELQDEKAQRLRSEHLSQEVADRAAGIESRHEKILERLYWECTRKARVIAKILAGLIAAIIIAGLASGLGLRAAVPTIGWVLSGCSIVLLLLSLGNLVFGSNVREFYRRVYRRVLRMCLRRTARATDVSLNEFRTE